MGLAGVVPIILNCYVGHQSVHGIMGMLKPYTPGRQHYTPDWFMCMFTGHAMSSSVPLSLTLFSDGAVTYISLYHCCLSVPLPACVLLLQVR